MKRSGNDWFLPILYLLFATAFLVGAVVSLKLGGIFRGPGMAPIVTRSQDPESYYGLIVLFFALAVLGYWGAFLHFYFMFKRGDDARSLEPTRNSGAGPNKNKEAHLRNIQEGLRELARNRDQYDPQTYRELRAGYLEGLRPGTSFPRVMVVSSWILFAVSLGATAYFVLSSPDNRLNMMSIICGALALFLGLAVLNSGKEYRASRHVTHSDMARILEQLKAEGLISDEDSKWTANPSKHAGEQQE